MKIKPFYAFSYLLLMMLGTGFIYSRPAIKITGRKKSIAPALAFQIDTLVKDLRVPWQIAFLPDGTMLFTERPGRLRLYRKGMLREKPLFSVSDISARVKTGLLGLVIHPQFISNHYIYMASNYMENDKMRLRVTRYSLQNDTLSNPFVIIKDIPANQNHTGCRLVFGPDLKLYITTGDADQPSYAQDLKAYNGKILRINDDGTIPTDNPFVDNDTAHKEIWSLGHRNTQGLCFQPYSKVLFNTEHGPTGGDEINIIQKGLNYGWPVIHHQNKQEGMISPLLEYSPSIGPSEAVFYNAAAFPELKGNLLVACLRGEEILRIVFKGQQVMSQEVLFKNRFGRIRSLVVGPDGFIYLSTSHYDLPESKGEAPFDLILRLRPTTNMLKKESGKTIKANVSASTGKSKKMNNATAALFEQLCASCHGANATGTVKALNFKSGKFSYGTDLKSIKKNITTGITEKGMPAWGGAISTADIEKLAIYIKGMSRK